jgi:transcription antitermination factor NusG
VRWACFIFWLNFGIFLLKSPDCGSFVGVDIHKFIDCSSPQWFCIQTKPGQEVSATMGLTRVSDEIRSNIGDLEIYYPKIRTSMPVGGVPRLVIKSLFPRYFFAKFIWMSAARFVESRSQILGIVKSGGIPTIVPDSVINDLSSWSNKSDVELFDPSAHFSPGQRVLIKTGLFKGMEADFISHLSDQKRVSLLLNFLHTHINVIIDRSLLKPVI